MALYSLKDINIPSEGKSLHSRSAVRLVLATTRTCIVGRGRNANQPPHPKTFNSGNEPIQRSLCGVQHIYVPVYCLTSKLSAKHSRWSYESTEKEQEVSLQLGSCVCTPSSQAQVSGTETCMAACQQ